MAVRPRGQQADTTDHIFLTRNILGRKVENGQANLSRQIVKKEDLQEGVMGLPYNNPDSCRSNQFSCRRPINMLHHAKNIISPALSVVKDKIRYIFTLPLP